ncbi:MAG: hypothetical protein WD992_03775 [Candidatus Levyibacteriota bacterium]
MPAERELRPFLDTQLAYRQEVEKLVSQIPSITASDGFVGDESPDSTSIKINNQRNEIPLSLSIEGPSSIPAYLKAHNTTQIDLYTQGLSREDAGKFSGITRERVRQVTKQSFIALVGSAQGFNFRKPLFEQRVGNILKEEVRAGASYQDLRRKGFSSRQIQNVRATNEDIDLPQAESKWEGLLKQLSDPEVDLDKKGELIKQVPLWVYFYRPEHFIDIYDVSKQAGIWPRKLRGGTSFLAEYLESCGIPIGIAEQRLKRGKHKGNVLRYHFTLIFLKDEVVELLNQAQGDKFDLMRRKPIEVIGPTPDNLPSTTDIARRREDYETVFSLFYGVTTSNRLRGDGIRVEDVIGNNPPVPVFRITSKTRFYVRKADAETLKKYLKERLNQLRSEKM